MLRQLLLVWFAVGASVATISAADRPNVLLICVDDLKPTLGCYGDPIAVTPHIDALAGRGVRFDAAYCNQAVCSPSRNALMTGLRPQTLGVYDLSTHFRLAAPDAVTVSQYFMGHGYHAAGLGKIFHVGHGNVDDKASWSVPSWRPKAPGYVDPESLRQIRPDSQGRKRGPATEAVAVSDDTYADGQIAQEAVARLRAAKESAEPFFLAVGFLKPHLPFVAPQKYWDLYDPAELPMPQITTPPVDAPSFAGTSYGELRNYSDMPAKGDIDEQTTRHLIHGYYAATSYMDAQLGKVITAVDELSLADNTIIVLWGDHGWHLGDHGMWCKHTNYEQAARIPIIIAAPGAARGAASSALIETVDIYPTLTELAGIEMPAAIDGKSFAAVVRDSDTAARPFVTHVYPRGGKLGRAIRDQRYRMVQWKVPGGSDADAEIELYDYQQDPLESKNIAADQPQVVQAMLQQLAGQPEAKPQWKKESAGKSSASSKQPRSGASKDRGEMFRKRDRDGDGFLSRDEFLQNQPDPDQAPARFPKFDRNGDQRLSAEEFIRSGKD